MQANSDITNLLDFPCTDQLLNNFGRLLDLLELVALEECSDIFLNKHTGILFNLFCCFIKFVLKLFSKEDLEKKRIFKLSDNFKVDING